MERVDSVEGEDCLNLFSANIVSKSSRGSTNSDSMLKGQEEAAVVAAPVAV